MNKKFLKHFTKIATPMFILALITLFNVKSMPDKIYLNEIETISEISDLKSNLINKINITKEKIDIKFLGILPVKSIPVQTVPNLEVYPGGSSVGIKLASEGVLVVGFSEVSTKDGSLESPAKECGIQLGDTILKVNGEKVKSSKDLIDKVKNGNSEKVLIDIIREDAKLTKEITALKEGEEYKLGLWIRDSIAGIGTLTFYDENTKVFGALGHPITDGDTNTTFTVKNGELLKSTVFSVRKGEKGNPGELKGIFSNENNSLGNITKNKASGIYGTCDEVLINPVAKEKLPIGFRNEIKEGPAEIISTISEEGPKRYAIEIMKLCDQNKPTPKSMVIKVVDPELLEKTGGIVQGMSGSPIIQDGKLVGAVTHVLVNKPDYGYGIYIEWMLKDAEIID